MMNLLRQSLPVSSWVKEAENSSIESLMSSNIGGGSFLKFSLFKGWLEKDAPSVGPTDLVSMPSADNYQLVDAIDFGLAKKYRDSSTHQHIPYRVIYVYGEFSQLSLKRLTLIFIRAYLEPVRDYKAAAKVALKLVELVYYKPQEVYGAMRNFAAEVIDDGEELGTEFKSDPPTFVSTPVIVSRIPSFPASSRALMDMLVNLIYKNRDERTKARSKLRNLVERAYLAQGCTSKVAIPEKTPETCGVRNVWDRDKLAKKLSILAESNGQAIEARFGGGGLESLPTRRQEGQDYVSVAGCTTWQDNQSYTQGSSRVMATIDTMVPVRVIRTGQVNLEMVIRVQAGLGGPNSERHILNSRGALVERRALVCKERLIIGHCLVLSLLVVRARDMIAYCLLFSLIISLISNALGASPETISILSQDASFARDFQETLVGASLVKKCLDGVNSSIFVYGQSGSGKTFTIWGPTNALSEESICSNEQGLTPRVFQRLFSRIDEEQKEHAVKELVHQCSCSSLEGMSNRRIAVTNLNIQSSYLHSVFTCIVESQCNVIRPGVEGTLLSYFTCLVMDGLNCFKTNRMNLVDLAGTKRQEATGATGERQKESHHINRSLTQLGGWGDAELAIVYVVSPAQRYQKDFLSCRRIENAPISKPTATNTDIPVSEIYWALRMSVKLHLMLNSKMLIDGDGERDPIVATSLLEASNLLVLKGGSVIQSNSNLAVHGQGSLNLTMADIVIEAQYLFYQYFVVSM
ncbi:kinesin-like protein KIN-12B [Tanacetum coccineum]